MAHIEDRWEKNVNGQRLRTARFGQGNRWRARYLDPQGRERSRTFARKIDATRFLTAVESDKMHGAYIDPDAGNVTLEAYFADWASRQLWETGTRRAMDLALRSSCLGGLPLGKLRRSHIETWIKRMSADGLAPGTVKTRVNNVRAVLRAAVRDRAIAADPSDNVVLPRDRRREAAMVLPTAEQISTVMAAAEPRFEAFVALAAFAGLRLGEAAGLQVGDLNFLSRSLDVRRQVQRGDAGALEIRAPKCGSERTVFLADGLLELLSRHIATHRQSNDPRRWLFEASPGLPPHQNSVGHQWRRACRRAGVTEVTLHDLRHFYASGLIAAGCDVVTVQRALGHAKATTTLNTYAHLWPSAEDRTRQAAGELFAATLGNISDGPVTAQEGQHPL
jgi:integrase